MKHFHDARISPINYHSYYRKREQHISSAVYPKSNLFMTYSNSEVGTLYIIRFVLGQRPVATLYVCANQSRGFIIFRASIRDQSCNHLLTDSKI